LVVLCSCLRHRDIHSFPTRRSSDLRYQQRGLPLPSSPICHTQFRLRFSGRSIPAPPDNDFLFFAVIAWCSTSWSVAGLTLILVRSEEHTSELQSRFDIVCRLLLEK